MVNNPLRIALLLALFPLTTLIWIMNSFTLNTLELWHPFADIFAVWVEFLALEERIEDSEVWLRIYAS